MRRALESMGMTLAHPPLLQPTRILVGSIANLSMEQHILRRAHRAATATHLIQEMWRTPILIRREMCSAVVS